MIINHNKTVEQLRDQLTRIHNALYDRASKLIRQQNPCQIQAGPHCATCAASRLGHETNRGLCCEGCKFLGANGCTVKALGCKLWTCRTAGNNLEGWAFRHLDKLSRRARRLTLNGCREPHEIEVGNAVNYALHYQSYES